MFTKKGFAAAAIFCFFQASCSTNDGEPISAYTHTDESVIDAAVASLHSQGYIVSQKSPQIMPDGSVHHYKIHLRKGNAKSRKMSILSDGKLVSDMNSRKIYNEDYFKKYGVLREHAAHLLEKEPYQKYSFAVWFDKSLFRNSSVWHSRLLKAIWVPDPDATNSRGRDDRARSL